MSPIFIPLDTVGLFSERWPELTFYAILIGVVAFAAVRVTTFYHTKIKAVADKVKDSDCARHGMAINDFHDTTKLILHKIDFIERKIDFVEKALVAQKPEMLSAFSQTNSPRQLNERGSRLMSDSGSDRILDEHKDDLVLQIEDMRPDTAYDVEQHAYAVLIMNTSQQWFNPLKEFVFNTPVYEDKSIDLGAICFVMSIRLRDYYFERHPEIEQESVNEKSGSN
jgi:hypothetical protein